MKIWTIAPIMMTLASCGGGSTSGSPVASYTTLKVFSDGAGVGAGVGDDGSKVVFIVPDVAATVAEANTVTQQDLADLRVSDFPIAQNLPSNANLRTGTITVDGVVANVVAIEDLGGEAGLILLDIPGLASAGMATGTALTGTPVGQQTYSGTMTMGPRDVNPNQELGSFSMNADFANGTYSFNGSTTSNSLSGSGVINIQSGTFNSNNLSANTNGLNRTASMYGQMHGNAATSVSGVFHTNEVTADYAGGFVGSRP